MPRGGRRPGAGARPGNFNAVRSGNHSPRLAMVYYRLLIEPDLRALARALYEAGFFPPPSRRFNEDVRGVTDFLWRRWFDGSPATQSNSIKDDQTTDAAAIAATALQLLGGAPVLPDEADTHDPCENE